MKSEKLIFQVLTAVLLMAFAFLYARGFAIKDQSFGGGLAYVLPAVLALGLSLVTGAMALLTPSHGDE